MSVIDADVKGRTRVESSGPSSEEGLATTETGHSRRTVTLILAGLLAGLLLGFMDVTIVSTAGPTIISELGGLSLYAWVFSAFLIVQTVTIPIFGKLSDLYGRKRLFLLGVIVFMAGSVLSGASQSIVELVLFRAVQGLGFGAFVPTTIAIAGDMFPPERRGRVVVLRRKRALVPRVRRRREASAPTGPAAPSLPNTKRLCGDAGEPASRRGVLRHHRVHPSVCRRGPRRFRPRCEECRLWLHPPAHRRNPRQRCGHFEGGLQETRVPRCRDRLVRTPGPHLGPPVALPPADHRHRDPARVRQRDGDPGDDRGVPELRGERGNRHRVRP